MQAVDPQTKSIVSPPADCYRPHPSSPFIVITQPESWYTFYSPREGGRLSWHRLGRTSPVLCRVWHKTLTQSCSKWVMSHLAQKRSFPRRSSEPTSWCSTEQTKPNTTKAKIHQLTQTYHNTKIKKLKTSAFACKTYNYPTIRHPIRTAYRASRMHWHAGQWSHTR